MKMADGNNLKKAMGKNPNSFYQYDAVPDAVIADASLITPPVLDEMFMYDLPTKAGQLYALQSK